VKLTREPDFDVAADLEAISRHAEAMRSLFAPGRLAYTPAHFAHEAQELDRAEDARFYLIIRPKKPIALAIMPGLSHTEGLELMALAELTEGPGSVRPFEISARDRRGLWAARKAESDGAEQGRGVFAFLLGRPGGMAMLELEPEGLVMAMARFGARNILDPEPIMAQRMRLMRIRLGELA